MKYAHVKEFYKKGAHFTQHTVLYSLRTSTYTRYEFASCVSRGQAHRTNTRCHGHRILAPRYVVEWQNEFLEQHGAGPHTAYGFRPWGLVKSRALKVKRCSWVLYRQSSQLRDRSTHFTTLLEPKVHHRVHNSPPLKPILSQTNPIHNLTSYFFKVYLKIIFPSTSRSLSYLHAKTYFFLLLCTSPPPRKALLLAEGAERRSKFVSLCLYNAAPCVRVAVSPDVTASTRRATQFLQFTVNDHGQFNYASPHRLPIIRG
jgi:hypothetical protein